MAKSKKVTSKKKVTRKKVSKKEEVKKPEPVKVKVKKEKAELHIDSKTHIQYVPYIPRRIDTIPPPKKK
tara:strand:- start:2824 stop:3030 length:207 start_codon:yes stop_codon:yes gene_type:complete